MLKYLLYSIAVVLPIDLIWLGLVAKGFYDKHLGGFERTLRVWPAVLVYVLIPVGLAVLVMPRVASVKDSLLYGGIYGLTVYGVYDLTNYATLAKWSPTVVVVDMLWGTFLCAISSMLVYILIRRFV